MTVEDREVALVALGDREVVAGQLCEHHAERPGERVAQHLRGVARPSTDDGCRVVPLVARVGVGLVLDAGS